MVTKNSIFSHLNDPELYMETEGVRFFGYFAVLEIRDLTVEIESSKKEIFMLQLL